MEGDRFDAVTGTRTRLRKADLRTSRLRAPRQARHVVPDDEEQLRRVNLRIAAIVGSARVRDLGPFASEASFEPSMCCRGESGELYVGDPETIQELRRFYDQRHLLWRRLGPTRVHFGIAQEYRLNGYAYSFAPYRAWIDEFQREWDVRFPSQLRSRRDQLVWRLWHYRQKATLTITKLSSKVRGGMSRCVECNHVHRTMARTDWVNRKCKGCPKCGCMTRQEIPERETPVKPWRVTKAELRRRFKISHRRLERILRTMPSPRILQSGDCSSGSASATDV